MLDEAADRLCPADRHDGDVFGSEVASLPRCECLDGGLVAHTLDEDDRAHAGIVESLA
jgi:hypothetical protein